MKYQVKKPTVNRLPQLNSKAQEEKYDHAFMVVLADIVIDSFLLSKEKRSNKPV